MNTIKDQDLSKNQLLVKNIVEHAIDQANFTIKNLSKRPTVAMLMECENCLTDFMPVVKFIADDHIEYASIYDQMCAAIDAVQMGEDLVEIEFA
ncbi:MULTISPECIES: hypothetical protein [Pseudoalteromonas]|uniref:hypothetical protein n=1 Tax=Pseudoalteromonas TaxID=53246 RepID=UPI0002CB3A99|nr:MULTISPECIES: hypothetical protein [Pseudoalteromonas]ENN97515.1 hypothetical protein J139_17104 [Pseudoalteromonas agarivorans S816]TMS64187.1 hypothetical protein CWB83_18410 [Pseudoalteromonas sp. S1691]TMS68219.1 hypothetical protein CWB88_19835 [Pseudoalteromonas sp. S1941]TMS68333.1 hypothetical protein CWB86_12730 [Pseudoalteromonas sp. S1731]TMS76040.1 hypothetical protein CWB82_18405 [Pseudoalteromonas sp. S1690]